MLVYVAMKRLEMSLVKRLLSSPATDQTSFCWLYMLLENGWDSLLARLKPLLR